ncbi:MAG: YjbH domain-containing protein [Halocynthiibacter sp.]
MRAISPTKLVWAVAVVWLAFASSSTSESPAHPSLSFYGMPGVIDMPTATSLPDGQIALSTSFYGKTLRNTFAFQITPRLTGSFRYSILEEYLGSGSTLFDRSFDFQYRFLDETAWRPAMAVGIRDLGGTGIFGAEYFTATKSFSSGLTVTGGLGWGRLGSYNGFTNPLSLLNDGFKTRPAVVTAVDTGKIALNRFFRGDAALFGGINWQVNQRLAFRAEYSSDAYVEEERRGSFEHRSPFNFGLNYRFDNGVDLGAYYLYGSEVGVLLSYSFNPKTPRLPGGREGAPMPVAVRPTSGSGAASWTQAWATRPDSAAQTRRAMADALDAQNLELEALSLTGGTATLRLRNDHYDAEAQAIGRAARVMTQVLPASVETFTIIPVVQGIETSAITLQRSDLEELEFAPDGAWQSFVRARITEARDFRFADTDFAEAAYPQFKWDLGAYLAPALFDPDNPVRADLGAQLSASWSPSPGLVFSGQLRQPVIGNLDESTRVSNSVIRHVRSDIVLYDQQSDLEISYLTADYFFRPGTNLYGRVTAGYLERMYGGVSAELLWKPVDSRLALGAEINYARQRDFDVLWGFQDYETITGNASAYYEFGDGFVGQVDVGRYLAGDWGATFTLDREFSNGWRVGAYFTLTDVSYSDFGEGSFDKGIRLTIPVSWLSGEPTQKYFSTVIQPVTRDGGARLNVRNRLYELTRGYHSQSLNNRWGRFWR